MLLRCHLHPGFAAKRRAAIGATTECLKFHGREGRVHMLQPTAGAWHRSLGQPGWTINGGLPHPTIRRANQFAPYRVAFDIPQHGQQVIILFDRKRLEPPLPEVSTGFVMLVIPSHMGVLYPVHPRAEVAIGLRLHDQMEVIGHVAVAEDRQRQFDAGVADGLDEGLVVFGFMEDLIPGVTTVDDVVADATQRGSCSAWYHGSGIEKLIIEKLTDPFGLKSTI
jgi:hypothetical protein